MITRPEPIDDRRAGVLGRASPVVKLLIAVVLLVALASTGKVVPPLALAVVVLAAALIAGNIPPRSLARGLAPLWVAALTIGTTNALFSGANTEPAATIVAAFGPFRLTEAGLLGGAGLAARVVAIAAIGVVFTLTTSPTRLVDSLVQQARVPERFAYGALAAYQAIPRFAEDLTSLRQARRIRGLGSGWHPRILVGLLVMAIRHADRVAIAMDARAFGLGPRSRYRAVGWGVADAAVALGALVVLAAFAWLAGVGGPR